MLILFYAGSENLMAMEMPRVKAVLRRGAIDPPRMLDKGWGHVTADGKTTGFCDLSLFFGLDKPLDAGVESALIHVDAGDKFLFFEATRIGSVVSPRPDQIEKTPPALMKGTLFFPKVIKKDGRLIPVLDPEQMGRTAPSCIGKGLETEKTLEPVFGNGDLHPSESELNIQRVLQEALAKRGIEKAVLNRMAKTKGRLARFAPFSEREVEDRIPFAMDFLFSQGKWADRLNRETAVAFGRALMRQLKKQKSGSRSP